MEHPPSVLSAHPAGGKSLWLEEALARPGEEDAPPLREHVAADVCIVGGGYTGLWTALRLKELEPSLDVVIVEAVVCGSGASGRNGGMVLSWWTKFSTMRKLFGTEEALRLGRASADAVSEIGRECSRLGIDAAYHHDGYLWAATNAAQLGSWQDTVEELDQVGEHPFAERTAAQLKDSTGTAAHVGGVFEASGAIVQPALLARGLRRAAMERGVRVYERSPMTALEPQGRVRTDQGSVTAGVVVLATNAWAIRFREVRRHILVIASDIVATPPIPERLEESGWTDGLGIADSRLLVHYYRTTDDGRIAFGKGGGALPFGGRVGRRFEGRSPREARVEEAFRWTYPNLADVPVARSWTGPIDRSRTGLPFFGSLAGRPNVLIGVGYSGEGVGPSHLGGRILASLALERDDEWSRTGLVQKPIGTFPPEPFRWVGGTLVRSAIERKERLEDRGRSAGPLIRVLVGLAPAEVPVKGHTARSPKAP